MQSLIALRGRLLRAAGFTASVAILATGVSLAALAQGLPTASPEEVGLSSDRLDRLSATMQQEVDRGAIPGAVVAIARNGKVAYEQAFGYQDRENRIPMNVDAIFRIASMSKPITSVAVMMLAEEGKIDVAAPVSQYLPEFKDLKVGMQGEPLKRPMTVQDLLRHTSGLAYQFFTEDPAVKQAYEQAHVFTFDQSLAEMVSKLAKLPLAHQPGTTWEYSMSTDVLGRVVEVASGMRFDQFIAERIAKPLNLTATGFWVDQAHAQAIAEPQQDPATGKRPAMSASGDPTRKPQWLSGGGGMVSTVDDYIRFAQMLLNGGELEGTRLLSPATVALMTADQLPPNVAYNTTFTGRVQDLAPTPEMGQGFGLGFMVRKEQGRNPLPGSVGDFSWTGAYGTYFWVDPEQELIACLMVQNGFDEKGLPESARLRHDMRYLVYQAVVGPPEGTFTGSSEKD